LADKTYVRDLSRLPTEKSEITDSLGMVWIMFEGLFKKPFGVFFPPKVKHGNAPVVQRVCKQPDRLWFRPAIITGSDPIQELEALNDFVHALRPFLRLLLKTLPQKP
jgi:hypothetical protein